VCRSCNQKGYVEKVCKRKQQGAQIAQETDDEKEKHLFVATCFASDIASETWLIDSGCTHHMTHDKGMFVKLDKTHFSKVRIENGDYIEVKGIGDIVIDFGSGKRIISDILYVPKIDQNLLSVGQLLENDYVIVFKDKTCEVFDTTDIKLMSIKMKDKSFSVNIQTDLAYSFAVEVGIWEKAETIEEAKKKKRMKKRLERPQTVSRFARSALKEKPEETNDKKNVGAVGLDDAIKRKSKIEASVLMTTPSSRRLLNSRLRKFPTKLKDLLATKILDRLTARYDGGATVMTVTKTGCMLIREAKWNPMGRIARRRTHRLG